jgi:segregation and condensation protein A
MEKEKYQVKTAVFDGPMDVLLRLIEERKLFINEISLAAVTDDYINYIRSLQEGGFNMGEITSFIVVAATLILIKSKSLLPNLALSTEEESQIGSLEERLRLYQAAKDAGIFIKNTFGQNRIFARGEVFGFGPVWSPDPAITIPNMFAAIREVVNNLPKKEFLPAVSVVKVISIEEMIDSLTDRIETSLKMSFSEISKGGNFENNKEQKVFVIVSFLAMLELVRQGVVSAMQDNNFEEISIEKQIISEITI